MAHEALVKEGSKALKENIKPEEVQDFFLKKGMDKKEATEAIEKLQAQQIVENAKKAEKEKKLSKEKEQKNNPTASSEKRSSLWTYAIIFIALLALGYYLYVSGIIDIKKFLS